VPTRLASSLKHYTLKFSFDFSVFTNEQHTLQQLDVFKNLGVELTSDGRRNKEIETRISKASAVLRELYRSVVTKRELSSTIKLSVFKPVFVSTLTYGHESWGMPERVPSQVQAAEMGFWRKVHGVTLRNGYDYSLPMYCDKVSSCEILKSLNVERLLVRIERSQLRWFGHVTRMPQERLMRRVLLAASVTKRPNRDRPRTRFRAYISRLACAESAELPEIATNRDVFRVLLRAAASATLLIGKEDVKSKSLFI